MRKKFNVFFSLTAMVFACFMGAGIGAVKTDRVLASSVVTESELVENYYQRVTMKKDGTVVRVVLHEGRNRQIRKMFESLELDIDYLKKFDRKEE